MLVFLLLSGTLRQRFPDMLLSKKILFLIHCSMLKMNNWYHLRVLMPCLMIFQREDDPLITGTRIVFTAVASETDLLYSLHWQYVSTIAMMLHWWLNFTKRDDITQCSLHCCEMSIEPWLVTEVWRGMDPGVSESSPHKPGVTGTGGQTG